MKFEAQQGKATSGAVSADQDLGGDWDQEHWERYYQDGDLDRLIRRLAVILVEAGLGDAIETGQDDGTSPRESERSRGKTAPPDAVASSKMGDPGNDGGGGSPSPWSDSRTVPPAPGSD
jgi:hypothetical protein